MWTNIYLLLIFWVSNRKSLIKNMLMLWTMYKNIHNTIFGLVRERWPAVICVYPHYQYISQPIKWINTIYHVDGYIFLFLIFYLFFYFDFRHRIVSIWMIPTSCLYKHRKGICHGLRLLSVLCISKLISF